jgi:starch synthase
LCRYLSWIPDVFNAHDWPAAPVSFFLATYQKDGEFGTSGSILTVHNLGYPGLFPVSDAGLLHRDSEKIISVYRGIRGGSLNFLALGLETADAVTTVSPTYAQEIVTPSGGHGLEDILIRRKEVLTGILNGMDYEEWNPSSDPALAPDHYDRGRMDGKARVKERLQRSAGLPVEPKVPLFGMIARLTGQKGLDLMVGADRSLEGVLKTGNIQVVVLGTGEGRYEEALKEAAGRYPRSLSASIAFDADFSRLIEGGSDFFLMPSLYEPCGLNQMYSLRYGTLPVARRTGGLADTIVDIRDNPGRGTGFLFDEATGEALAGVITAAANFYRQRPRAFAAARRRGMRLRFDWNRAAGFFEKTYRRAIEAGKHAAVMRRIGDN